MLSRPLRALIVGLLASALAGGLAWSGALDRLEARSVDERFERRGVERPGDVVIVGIDEATVDVHDFPFDRTLHARAIDALLDAGARAIAYDVQFSDPSAPRADRALVAAAGDERVFFGTAELTRAAQPVLLPALRRAAGERVGFALFPHDPEGVVRELQPRFHGVPQLSLLAAGRAAGGPDRAIDLPGPGGTVPELSFDDVLIGRLDPAAVRGKVVVVGATAPVLQDYHPTALGQMSGPELTAAAIQTALDGFPLRDAPAVAAALLVLAAGLLAPLATLVPGPPGRAVAQALGAGALGAVALAVGAQLAFDAGTIVPLVVPLLALLLGTAGAVALTYAVEVRSRRRLRTEFERFVAPAVATELLDRRGDAPLESRRVEATVLFCDLRGFTTLAERLEAEQVIAVLNRYLEEVSGALLDGGGTVVSYQGDGVMAVFGAPLPQPDHAARALAAARAVLDEALPRFNRWLLEQRLAEAPLEAGIGLNSGPVMAGVVGSARRVEYAAVGDTTNVAARLQALGRELEPPARLFASATTIAALGERGDGRDGLALHGDVRLKGRREPVVVWVGR